jgi:hypothetical protein
MLWDTIKNGNTPGWDPGKALEHLVIGILLRQVRSSHQPDAQAREFPR